MSAQQLFLGIVSGQRRRSHAEVADRAARIAGGIQRLGIKPGDSVCILMRNDIAFLEAAYAAMRLGAYGVPVNWHFKPEEIQYVLKDSGSSVLIGHADLLHPLRGTIPSGVTVLSVPTPPEILRSYRIDPDHLATPDFATDLESWLEQQRPYDGPPVPQPQNMIYTSGTTGNPKGVRRQAPTPEQTLASERMRALLYGLEPGVRALLPGPLYHSAPNSFGLRSGRLGGALTFATSDDALKKPGTVGKILDCVVLRFLGDNGSLLPQGEIGEIYSRTLGNPDFTYHNKPEKRAEIERDGFITSGDVGYVDADGYVFICDRKRDMVISGGVNIYPAEIEAALHAVPGVHDCAVFGIPDDEFGEALMAVVEPQDGVTLEITAIRAQLRASLAGYKVPKHVEIHENLPREDSGKIFKRRLRDPYWKGQGGGFEVILCLACPGCCATRRACGVVRC